MKEYLSTAIVAVILLAAVFFAAAYMIRNRRKGRGCCSGNCENCGRKCPDIRK